MSFLSFFKFKGLAFLWKYISYSNIFAVTVFFITSLSSTQCFGYDFTSSTPKILLKTGQKARFFKHTELDLKSRYNLSFPIKFPSVYVHENSIYLISQYFKAYWNKSMIHRSSTCLEPQTPSHWPSDLIEQILMVKLRIFFCLLPSKESIVQSNLAKYLKSPHPNERIPILTHSWL